MPAKLYVGNLPSSCSQEQLHTLFGKYGEVTELDIVKNFAFVHFDRESDAQKAVRELHDSDFKGSKLQVQFSKNQDINRGNKHILKSQESKTPHHGKDSHRRPERDRRESHDRDRDYVRSRLPPERVGLVGARDHRDHRAGLIAAANAAYRSKPYDRLPVHPAAAAAALPRFAAHPAALPYQPSARLAAYADYYKAAALAPAAAAALAAAPLAPSAAAAHPYAYYERLLELKDPHLVAAPVAGHPAYAALYPGAGAKDPYTNAQLAYERYAGATSRAAAYANAYGASASALRNAYPHYP